MKTWISNSDQNLEVFIPFLGKYHRPFLGRCCQTCTPRSWDGFYAEDLSTLGFRDVSRVTERDTRFRGWLVRRVCGFLATWEWEIPSETPRELPGKICGSRRVQDVASSRAHGCGGDEGSRRHWKEEICRILGEIQAPLSPLLLRLCHWMLPKLLSRLFLSVQLQRGQLEMVLRAARTPEVPLVFLCTQQSQLDGPLLSFLLLSQGIGAPRVTVGTRISPGLRSLLQRLGGIFLPSGMAQARSERDEGLPGAVLDAYVQEVLRSRQPLVIFLEEPLGLLQLSDPARRWLLRVLRALRDGAVPDVRIVPVGIAYDVAPGRAGRDGAPPQPLGIAACLRAAFQALRRPRGCARVDFSQPFSLREFVENNLVGPTLSGNRPEQLLLPTILGTCVPDVGNVGTLGAGVGTEEEILVTALGLHTLSDSSACSAIMAVGITAALLLHRHREAVLLPRLMRDFSGLLEQLLLRGRAVGFRGQLRALVLHSLRQLQPPGAGLGPPEASARGQLVRLAGGVRQRLGGEAAGACAIRALLLEVLPILGTPCGPPGIVLSREELLRKILEVLLLLPPILLGLQPCQPPERHSLDILDKLVLGGLLEEEEPESECRGCDVAPRPSSRGHSCWDFTDDSDSDSEDRVPKRCYKVLGVPHHPLGWGEGVSPKSSCVSPQLSEPQGFPGFLLFLCRLLSPVLRSYGRAAEFLERPPWPQPEADYVEALLEFLNEDEDGYLDRSLALSSLQSFKDMGVLEELQTPTGPLLQLSQPFQSASNREKLRAFIHQFTQL
ncbi:glycerol-3-phosphate acyltransferase 2, mitochondrial-like isoform X3 [Pipra filicauda]|uniref:Glycerol-3-phosphate acyltransferase 2, mitochondrial-like isoform X3 n=1 Tax=Pipra filicauda TaxID=649802 RepID=A0A7R5L0A4_9PASS|nr:glycerol-3-phosphate acyltransferase 2, mitochondrial-like isoform X3 [Pipra filicauda]XP_039242314.1 glycerol-3-phosphate acyltransferase 2, mitochondrial-like isoform X3 [Pipra filicauda]